MLPAHRRLAIIFDFDETLTDDSTSELLKSCDLTIEEIHELWDDEIPQLLDRGFDPTEAYLMLLVKELKRRGKLLALRDGNLREFGSTLTFHPGVIDLFDQLRKLLKGRMSVQFFVISGGLQEIIAGSAIAGLLHDFWGCTFHWDSELDLPYPKNVISFTEKTRCLFQIHKGLIGAEYKNKPHAVNEYMHPKRRHVPLENMIYIGDGLTDVPCFSIVDNNEGRSICVYNRSRSRREGIQRSIDATRHRGVFGPYRADYRPRTGLRECLSTDSERIAESTPVR